MALKNIVSVVSVQSGRTAGSKAPVRFLNIQILRAYAAFTVVYFHTGFKSHFLPSVGSFGVNTFFVISGFIMVYICATNPQNFLLRRIARIVPLYWLTTLGVVGVAYFAPFLMKATRADALELAKSLLFIPFFKSNGLDQPSLFVGWSINDEMYFYAVIAVALLLTRRRAAPVAFTIILATFLFLQGVHNTSAAGVLYSRINILGFLLGMICFWVYERFPRSVTHRYRHGIVFLGIAAATGQIAVSIYGQPGTLWTKGATELTPAVLVLCAVLLDGIGFSLDWKAVILLGDASYATYLTHYYCVEGVTVTAGRLTHFLRQSEFPGMLLSLIVAHCIGVLIYLYFDRPTHNWFRHKLDRVPSFRETQRVASETRTAKAAIG